MNDLKKFKKLEIIEKPLKSNTSEVSNKSVKSDKTVRSKRTNKSIKSEAEVDKPRTRLIQEPSQEMFKSIKEEKPKTSLIVMKRENTNTSALGSYIKKQNTYENEIRNDSELVKFSDSTYIMDDSTVKSVQDMAKLLVDQVIEETKSHSDFNSPKNKSPHIMNIEQNYRYVLEDNQGVEVHSESKTDRNPSRLKSGRRSAM